MDRNRRSVLPYLAAAGAAPLVLASVSEAEAANQVFTTYAFPATGGNTARTTPARAGDTLSIKEFGCVGDGVTNDSAGWLAAIASGKSLFVPAGTYIVGDAVATPATGQTIRGIPGKSILSKTTTGGATKEFFNVLDVFDVVIDGLVLNNLGNPQYGFIIRATTGPANKTSNTPSSCGRITFRNCTFFKAPTFIQRYVNTVWIENNKFLGGGAAGALNGVSTGGTIVNGLGHPTAAEVLAGPPTPADGLCQNILICNNYFYQLQQEAVDINWQTSNVVIDGNIIVDPGMDGSTNESIDVGGSSDQGICYNFAITNNMIFLLASATASTNGINIKGDTENSYIAGNHIESSHTTTTTQLGIQVHASAVNVRIIGNDIKGFYDGIQVTNTSSQCIISENTASLAGRNGFNLFGDHITLTNNQAYNNSQALANQYGFSIDTGCDYMIIQGNKSYDNQAVPTQNGFFFAGASDRVIFNGNIAYPVKTTGVAGTGSLTNSLVGVAGNITA